MGRAVITGGAGFLGATLCRTLLGRGDQVVVVDNLVTGRLANIAELLDRPGFEFIEHDVSNPIAVDGPVDAVLHFASLASPIDYLAKPIQTLKSGSLGTHNSLGLAVAKDARYLLASTSEVYGDPEVHPQPETYWGHVNPVGPRGVYDESKRFAESMATAYAQVHDVPVRIARIFNTYGPFMRPDDGRVVSNMLVQAISGTPLTIYGDGSQTRSFCFVTDLVAGLLALLDSDHAGPMNIGNPVEFTVAELATKVGEVLGVDVAVTHMDLPVDDPRQRRPDITLARTVLGWEPTVQLAEGLAITAGYFRQRLADGR
jgi:dTDP-glucose 4,6-dehydratase